MQCTASAQELLGKLCRQNLWIKVTETGAREVHDEAEEGGAALLLLAWNT